VFDANIETERAYDNSGELMPIRCANSIYCLSLYGIETVYGDSQFSCMLDVQIEEIV
jgi:hypothetical protein